MKGTVKHQYFTALSTGSSEVICLLARHEHYTVRIEVAPPKPMESPNGPIRATVWLVTELAVPLQAIFAAGQDTTVALFHSFASLNALYSDGGQVLAGSLLIIQEEMIRGDDRGSQRRVKPACSVDCAPVDQP